MATQPGGPQQSRPAPRKPQVEHLRPGITPPIVGVIFLITIGAAFWFFHTLAQAYYPELGVTGAIVIVLAGLGLSWWMGSFTWMANSLGIGVFSSIPVPRGLMEDPTRGEAFVDEYHRAARARINELVEALIYDYGVLLAGQEASLAYASPHVVAVLRQAVAPVLRTGDTIRPDFGNHVQIDIEWNAGDVRLPVTATAQFMDQSTRVPLQGMAVRMPPRRMVLTAAFDHQFTQIIDATIGPA